MLCEASLCQFIMRACSIYQTPLRHMMMTGSPIQYIRIRTICVLSATLGTGWKMKGAESLSVDYVVSIEDIMLASQHHKIMHGYSIYSHSTGKQRTWQKDNPVAYLICQMTLVDEEVHCHTVQWNILLIQSYLACPLHSRFITLLKQPMKASLGPSSPCIIHAECLLLQTHWVSRSFSSELWPKRAGCPAG